MSVLRSQSTIFNDVPLLFAIIEKSLVAMFCNMSKLFAMVALSMRLESSFTLNSICDINISYVMVFELRPSWLTRCCYSRNNSSQQISKDGTGFQLIKLARAISNYGLDFIRNSSLWLSRWTCSAFKASLGMIEWIIPVYSLHKLRNLE